MHWSVNHDRCKLTQTCERFPICDNKITKNDQCVIKIIGIHCYRQVCIIMYLWIWFQTYDSMFSLRCIFASQVFVLHPSTNPWLSPFTRFIWFNCAIYQSETSDQWNDSIYWCLGECFLGNPHCWPSYMSRKYYLTSKQLGMVLFT